MKNLSNKSKMRSSSLALVLVLAMAASAVLLPTSNAHTPPLNIPTWAFLTVTPNPVGVNQAAYVNFWLDKAPPTAAGAYGDRWHGMTVKVTKPDGTTSTLGTYNSDAVGGAWAEYVPTAIGTYTFVFNYPGQTITGENPNPRTGTSSAIFVGDNFLASTSEQVTLTVQQGSVPYLPLNPLPTGYWQRPINSENLGWSKISGNWLGLMAVGFTRVTGQYNASGNFNPFTTAPNTAHIAWTKPLAPGGLIGGEFGDTEYGSSYMQTPQYEPKFGGIIMNGVLYYQELPGSSTYPSGWNAVNIRTGETIWKLNTTVPLLNGQVLSYVSPNQFGGLSYLWTTETTKAPNIGTTYGIYDAMTGNWVLNIVNGTSVTWVEADDGTLLGYYVNNTDKTLCLWNSTECILYPSGHISENWQWRPPLGASIDFKNGIMWRKPLVTSISGANITPTLSISTLSSDIVLLMSIPELVGGYSWQPGWRIIAGYSAKNGQLLWGPLNETEVPWTRVTNSRAANGIWAEFTHETMTWSGYSLSTGQKIWGPTEPYPVDWGYYVCYPPVIAYGKLYVSDFGGYVHAYDITSGKRVWSSPTGPSGYETPYGNYPLLHIELVADGKVYVAGGHTYSPPLFRGSQLWCINATTGEKVWSISSFVDSNSASGAIADGYLVEPNGYDNQLYCYGKGLSATTVSAPDLAVAKGTAVLLKGTITDQSSGQTSLGIPAAGTPAISDVSMTSWMEYLYMQQPKPNNASGVKVHLTAIDPNGNFQDIGTTTSDTNGKYGITWIPPVEGTYHVTARFEGSESYYSSEDTTYFAVGQAAASPVLTTPTAVPTTTAAPTPVQTPSPSPSAVIIPPTSGMPATTYIAIGAAVIIVVAAAAALILRKRK